MDRRQLIKMSSGAFVAAIAGCLGEGDISDEEDSTSGAPATIEGFRRWLQPNEPFQRTNEEAIPRDVEYPLPDWRERGKLIRYEAEEGASFSGVVVYASINKDEAMESWREQGFEVIDTYRDWEVLERDANRQRFRFVSESGYINSSSSQSIGEDLIDTYLDDRPSLEEEQPRVTDVFDVITPYANMHGNFSSPVDAPHSDRIEFALLSQEVDGSDGSSVAIEHAIAFDFEITEEEAWEFAEGVGEFAGGEEVTIVDNIALFEAELD